MPQRTKRVTVRLTKDEDRIIRSFAGEIQCAVSELFRSAAIYPDGMNQVTVVYDDLYVCTKRISALTECCRDQTHMYLYVPKKQHIRDEIWQIHREISGLSEKLLMEIRRCREQVRKILSELIQNDLLKMDVSCQRGSDHSSIGIAVTLSEVELQELRKAADEKNCSLSCYMKKKALLKAELGVFYITSYETDSLNVELGRYLRFLEAILAKTIAEGTDESDLKGFLAILNGVMESVKSFDLKMEGGKKNLSKAAEDILEDRKRGIF